MEILLFQIATEKKNCRRFYSRWIVLLLGHPRYTHHLSRTGLWMQRRCSHRRTRWAFPCTSRRCGTTSRSCCSALCSPAPLRESPWLFLPGPGPFRSTAETECIPESPSVGWLFHLKGKYCKCKHVPRCFVQDFTTKQNWGLTEGGQNHDLNREPLESEEPIYF